MVLRLIAILLALVCGLQAANPPQTTTILGVLEDTPGTYAGQPNLRSVRIVFQKNGADWRPFRHGCFSDDECLKTAISEYPHEMSWTIAFDGRNLGQITTRNGSESSDAVGEHEIAGPGPVPTIGKRSTEFGGFLDAEVYRPLVAVSQPYFKDPDVWKPAQPANDLLVLSRQQFRKRFPKLCKLDEHGTKLKPRPYRDEELKLGKAYSSKSGWSLVELRLAAVDCEDTEAGFDLDNQWFVIDPQKSARFLGAGMWLVDAGDYDNGGKSEVLFSIDQYNRGGYILFYDDFKKQASFEFSYH